jgi:hypothetical protein
MLAAWFLILGDAIAGGSLLSFFSTLLSHALWLVPWGLLGFVAAIFGIMALGLIRNVRLLGGISLFVLAAGCLLVVAGADRSGIDLGKCRPLCRALPSCSSAPGSQSSNCASVGNATLPSERTIKVEM